MQISIHSPTAQSSPPTSNFITHCLHEYEQKLNQKQNQFSEYDSEQQTHPEQLIAEQQTLKYYGYEDKKSITIKPIKMHKDLISLRKENHQKKQVIQDLEQQNQQLKAKYGTSMKDNHKVQKFLKDIEFTFKNDKKTQKANQIMLKAKKMLYREALQCQNNTKKITKGPQANTVQQIKMYIEFMQLEKDRLKKMIDQKRKENQLKREQEDFNLQNENKFEKTLERVEKMLNIEMKRAKRHQEVYKIEKGMVCTGLKEKEIMLKKKSIEKYYQKLKDLMLKKQGEQYEIVVLQKKRKDKIKLVEQMKQFKNDITMKKTSIEQLQKELKEKMKTYDYMSKWTKELKVKLEEKKENHITNKISYEKKINALSREFEDWNKKYKLQLVEDQLGSLHPNGTGINRKKGGNSTANPNKDMIFGQNAPNSINPTTNSKDHLNTNKDCILFNGNNKEYLSGCGNAGSTKKVKLIKIEQIRKIVKKIKLYILTQEINLQEFLPSSILYSKPKQPQPATITSNKSSSKPPQNPHISILTHTKKSSFIHSENPLIPTNQKQPQPSTQDPTPSITLKQLFDNLKSHLPILSKESDSQIMKLARYIVEDHENIVSATFTNSIKTTEGYVPNLAINKKIALTIMKKLFQNELKSLQEVQEVKKRLKQFLTKFYDPFRYDILKMLLHMDGLKGVQKQPLQEWKQQQLSVSHENSLLNSNPTHQQPNGSQMMSNMKRNQQLHLQLELDEAIFLLKLKKHVIEQFYVARFKQVFDLMIYQEFFQVDKPRLGMFDRVCEMITQKKLIKENITREYNFNTIKSFDQCEEEVKEGGKLLQRDGVEDKKEEQRDSEIVIRTHKINMNSNVNLDGDGGYWIVKPPKKRISVVDHLNRFIHKPNGNQSSEDQEQQHYIQQQKKFQKTQNKHWLDDLMSDGHNSDPQI